MQMQEEVNFLMEMYEDVLRKDAKELMRYVRTYVLNTNKLVEDTNQIDNFVQYF